MVVPQRGEIWWADLSDPVGSGPGYRRPVLVIQSNSFNASALKTTIVAAITGNLDARNAPGNVHLSKSTSGLSRPSVVNVSQLLAIDRSLLLERVGQVSSRTMNSISEGLRLVLAL
ncbi:MAG: type II toxin-antitoxin system PemK/MazF family toxin [Hyphomicrobiales bacterium]|nr:type II toxin-antitoxin system PemK/MazF family toxin [Hyphomicrobiales bacterium]